MKKLVVLLTITVLLILTAACGENTRNDATTNKSFDTQTEIHIQSTVEIDGGNKEESELLGGGGYITSNKYRQCYYDVPYDFVVLVGKDEYNRWYDEIYEFNSDESQFVSFVQYFNISKEVFEKTNLQMAKSFAEFNPTMRPMDYENQQTYEIYNADIIYTFDDDIINEYYRTPDYPYCADFEYEAAVKRGEYTSQTEEWVDVEALEAEIIAKYGEVEIVTEETSATPTEPIETTAEQTKPIE